MPAFRRVDLRQAGARALGILVPHGVRTVVVVRPRTLPWDLLPVAWSGTPQSAPTFPAFTREEAAGVARRLPGLLERAVAEGCNPVETFGDNQSFQIWVRTPEYFWLVCQRLPGQAYRPLLFSRIEEAQEVAAVLVPIVWPSSDANQEYYFNTQNFS